MASDTLKNAGFARKDMFMVDVDKLVVEPGLNIRTDFGDMDGMVATLKENGISAIPPLKVKCKTDEKGLVTVVDGHRRLKAIGMLNASLPTSEQIVKVPCLAELPGTSEESRIVGMFLQNAGKPLTALEEAEGIKRLLNKGMSEKDIGVKLGRSEKSIKNRLILLEAPDNVKEAVKDGSLTPTAALQVAILPMESQVEVVKKATKAKKEGKKSPSVSDVKEAAGKKSSRKKKQEPIVTVKKVDISKVEIAIENMVRDADKEIHVAQAAGDKERFAQYTGMKSGLTVALNTMKSLLG